MSSNGRIVKWIDQPRNNIGEYSLPLMVMAGIIFFLVLTVSIYFIGRYLKYDILPRRKREQKTWQLFYSMIEEHAFDEEQKKLLEKIARQKKEESDPSSFLLSIKIFDELCSLYLTKVEKSGGDDMDKVEKNRQVQEIRSKLFLEG